MSATLILLRHGRSAWNQQNIFSGWVDIPLDEEGIKESQCAGEKIRDIPIDAIYTSTLIRAQMTVVLTMMNHASGKVPVFMHAESDQLKKWSQIHSEKTLETVIPVYPAWQLNERYYGKLQGLNKAETAAEFGADQVKLWRRSFSVRPPDGESLEDTAARTIPFFQTEIIPRLEKGENVFIAAHGNSLRSIIMYMDQLTPTTVLDLEIPTGQPILYSFERGKWQKST